MLDHIKRGIEWCQDQIAAWPLTSCAAAFVLGALLF